MFRVTKKQEKVVRNGGDRSKSLNVISFFVGLGHLNGSIIFVMGLGLPYIFKPNMIFQ